MNMRVKVMICGGGKADPVSWVQNVC